MSADAAAIRKFRAAIWRERGATRPVRHRDEKSRRPHEESTLSGEAERDRDEAESRGDEAERHSDLAERRCDEAEEPVCEAARQGDQAEGCVRFA